MRSILSGFLFPGFFPGIRNYHVDNNRVYILTFKEKKGKKEVLVYNSRGEFLKKKFLPLAEINILQLYPYTIKDNKIYQLKEDEEAWKVKIIDLAQYEESLKVYRDLKGVVDTSYEEGKAEGKIVMARELKKKRIDIHIIAEASGLSKEEIEKL